MERKSRGSRGTGKPKAHARRASDSSRHTWTVPDTEHDCTTTHQSVLCPTPSLLPGCLPPDTCVSCCHGLEPIGHASGGQRHLAFAARSADLSALPAHEPASPVGSSPHSRMPEHSQYSSSSSAPPEVLVQAWSLYICAICSEFVASSTPLSSRMRRKRGKRRAMPLDGSTSPAAAMCTGEIERSAARTSHTWHASNHTSGSDDSAHSGTR
mmetsp:Transcript_38704/g.77484  ORF Transcript_38704/g.77484 Transcript_38704/m.77484 type:complete len:211 (-) Transcript_38704:63-695(-)